MGGSRIRFAKIASKRFVGALFDDERVGLASYDTDARLRQRLTTDKDAVNASIDSLSAGGLTNTGGGHTRQRVPRRRNRRRLAGG
jgi:hypothetical protein